MTSTQKTASKAPAKKTAAKAKPAAKKPGKFDALDKKIVTIAADPQITTYDELVNALGKAAQGQPVKWRCMMLVKREQIPAGFWTKPARKAAS